MCLFYFKSHVLFPFVYSQNEFVTRVLSQFFEGLFLIFKFLTILKVFSSLSFWTNNLLPFLTLGQEGRIHLIVAVTGT